LLAIVPESGTPAPEAGAAGTGVAGVGVRGEGGVEIEVLCGVVPVRVTAMVKTSVALCFGLIGLKTRRFPWSVTKLF
jgi:hypothetical protein